MMKAARRSNPTTKVSAAQSSPCFVDGHRPGVPATGVRLRLGPGQIVPFGSAVSGAELLQHKGRYVVRAASV
jgi:hypothetical protein